jgi:molecular chaperone Hsp33
MVTQKLGQVLFFTAYFTSGNTMKKPDQSQRYLFADHPIRGQYVSLDQSWHTIAKQTALQGRALTLLGEALAVVVLLVDTLKIQGSVTLQVRGKGPLGLLVVEANSEHKVRGTARQDGNIGNQMDLQEIFGSDYLVITIKTKGAESHQGIAPLRGSDLAAALEYYFATSEQLQTRFWLACNEQNVSGMLIQKLPGKTTDDDAWDRVLQLADTVTDEELQQIALDELLHRLFHQEKVLVFDPNAVDFACSCSRERSGGMLLTLDKVEVIELLEAEGEVAVTCEFCNAHYSFDRIDIEQVFLAGETAPSSTTTH